MKVVFYLFVTLISFKAFAHCPAELAFDGEIYCTSVKWLNSDQKKGGALVISEAMSPYLNKQGATPPTWHYSKANVMFWKKGDAQHTSLFINNLRVFPYMEMLGGHHHGASYQWQWDSQNQVYVISGFALSQMEGCWSLRATTALTDDLSSSRLIMEVTDYSNASADEKFAAETLCDLCSSRPPEQGGDHGAHH